MLSYSTPRSPKKPRPFLIPLTLTPKRNRDSSFWIDDASPPPSSPRSPRVSPRSPVSSPSSSKSPRFPMSPTKKSMSPTIKSPPTSPRAEAFLPPDIPRKAGLLLGFPGWERTVKSPKLVVSNSGGRLPVLPEFQPTVPLTLMLSPPSSDFALPAPSPAPSATSSLFSQSHSSLLLFTPTEAVPSSSTTSLVSSIEPSSPRITPKTSFITPASSEFAIAPPRYSSLTAASTHLKKASIRHHRNRHRHQVSSSVSSRSSAVAAVALLLDLFPIPPPQPGGGVGSSHAVDDDDSDVDPAMFYECGGRWERVECW